MQFSWSVSCSKIVLSMIHLLKGKKNERLIISEEEFSDFQSLFKISLPADVVYAYSKVGRTPTDHDDIYREVKKRLARPDWPITFYVEINEAFAYRICEKYKSLTPEEREIVDKSAEHTFMLSGRKNSLEILLVDVAREEYDVHLRRYKNEFLQSVLEENFDESVIIVAWIIHFSGGSGSLILNTDKVGCQIVDVDDVNQTILFDGIQYEYRSSQFQHLITYYPDCMRNEIMEDIETMQQLLQKAVDSFVKKEDDPPQKWFFKLLKWFKCYATIAIPL